MGVTQNIIETDFQRNNTSVYQLSILIGVDSLVYSIYGDESNKLLVCKTISLLSKSGKNGQLAKALNEALEKEDMLSSLYGQVKIAFLEPTASLVPGRLYNDDEKNTYLSELSSEKIGTGVYVDEVGPLKIRIVYQLDGAVLTILKSKFPNSTFYHISTAFLLGCHQMIPEGATETAFAFFQKEKFHLALFRQGELLFYNKFHCNSANDVLYFALTAFEQYGLDPGTAPLYLSGQVVLDSDIYKILYRYIAELSFLPAPSFLQFGKNAAAFEPNFFFPLHSMLLCK